MKKSELIGLAAACAVVVSINASADWVYFPAGHADNPHPVYSDDVATISNGNWVLNVILSGSNLTIGQTTKTEYYGNNKQGNAFTGIGSGTLDLRGAVRDVDDPSKTYTITSFAWQALGSHGEYASRTAKMVEFISPGTLTALSSSLGAQLFNINGTVALRHVVIDEPNLAGDWTAAWNFPATGLFDLELDLPGVTAIGVNVLSYYQNGNKSPYTNDVGRCWNLDGVTNIADNAMNNLGNVTGSLRLPSIRNIGANAFARATFTGLDFGSAGTPLAIASGAMPPGAVLKEVVFRGAVPALAAAAWGAETRAAKSLVIAVPYSDAEWKTFLEGHIVETVSASEALAFKQANPSIQYLPFAVVSKNAFGTANDQYLACCEAVDPPVVEWDATRGDSVTVSSDLPQDRYGRYPAGATLTFTAVPGTGASFAGWYGDVPEAVRTCAAITMAAGAASWIMPRFTRPWTYDGTSGTMTDGKWTLNVEKNSDGATTLTAGRGARCGLFATTGNEGAAGTLDMGGTISDGTREWTITRFNATTGVCAAKKSGDCGRPSVFFSPGTLAGVSSQLFNVNTSQDSIQTYTTVVIDEPAASCSFPRWFFAMQTLLDRVILRCGGAVSLPTLYFCGAYSQGATLAKTDLSWWKIDGVTAIGAALAMSETTPWRTAEAHGVLSLPNCTSVDAAAFRAMANLEGVVLGGATKDKMVTSIGANAFAGCTGLKTLTIHSSESLAVDSTAFMSAAPQTITFLGKPPSSEALDSILTAVDAQAGGKDCVICASQAFPQWRAGAGLVSALSSEEAEIAPEGAFGVYRAGLAAPFGKAWVVNRKSEYEPRATTVIIR